MIPKFASFSIGGRPATPLSERTAKAVREAARAVLDLQRVPGELYSVDDVEIADPAGTLRVRVYRPFPGRLHPVLFLHGGRVADHFAAVRRVEEHRRTSRMTEFRPALIAPRRCDGGSQAGPSPSTRTLLRDPDQCPRGASREAGDLPSIEAHAAKPPIAGGRSTAGLPRSDCHPAGRPPRRVHIS